VSTADAVHAEFAVEVADEMTRMDSRWAEPPRVTPLREEVEAHIAAHVGLLGDAIRAVSARRRPEGRPVPLIRRWADLGSKPWREWTADEECVAEFHDVLGSVPGRAARMRELELALARADSVDALAAAWEGIVALNAEVLAEVNKVRRDEQRLILQGMPT